MPPKSPLELHRELYERRRQEMEARRVPSKHTEHLEPSTDGRQHRVPDRRLPPTKQNGHRDRGVSTGSG